MCAAGAAAAELPREDVRAPQAEQSGAEQRLCPRPASAPPRLLWRWVLDRPGLRAPSDPSAAAVVPKRCSKVRAVGVSTGRAVAEMLDGNVVRESAGGRRGF